MPEPSKHSETIGTTIPPGDFMLVYQGAITVLSSRLSVAAVAQTQTKQWLEGAWTLAITDAIGIYNGVRSVTATPANVAQREHSGMGQGQRAG